MLDCLNGQIGYIREACDCLPAIPESISEPTVSKTGFYITDLLPTDFTQNCSEAGIWTILQNQFSVAKSELSIELMKKYSQMGTVKKSISEYGGKDEVKPFNETTVDVGFTLDITFQRRNVFVTIPEVMLRGMGSDNTTYRVLDKNGDDVIEAQDLVVDNAATGWKKYSLNNIKLPLWNDSSEKMKYHILFSYINPSKTNESDCVSCTKPKYAAYFDLYGALKDTGSLIPTPHSKKENMFGIRPHFNIECDFESLICSASKNDINAAALTLYYLWAIKTLEYIINSGNINLFTALGGEYLEGLLSNHYSKFNESLNYLAAKIPTGECVICDPIIQRTRIRL